MTRLLIERPEPYDPLNYKNLAASVVQALMAQSPTNLPPEAPFDGVGVYALYYRGDFEAYASVKGTDVPIYVGSAVPAGRRKGGMEVPESQRVLYGRLIQHAKSIEQTENLRLHDFMCRYLVVVPVWITLAERFLIEH